MYKVIDERSLETDFPVFPNLSVRTLQTVFKVRYDDIDVNRHVNNAVYPLWASGSGSGRFSVVTSTRRTEIAFKKEGLFGEEIEVQTQIDDLTTLHSIHACSDGRELAKLRLHWK